MIFVRSSPPLKECKNYIQDKILNNFGEFQSNSDHTELNDFYDSLDLFILPSHYDTVGCVYVYMKALQLDVPIIGIKGQSIKKVIEQYGLGSFLIERGNIIHLAKFVQKFIEMDSAHNVSYNLNTDSFISDTMHKIERI